MCCLGFCLGCQVQRPPTAPSFNEPVKEVGVRADRLSEGGSRFLWGYYNCFADLEKGTITAAPSRSVDAHLNATQLLNKSLGVTISVQPSSNPPAGYFCINVGLTHPYGTKPGLCGFDVRGILLCTGSADAGGLRIPGADDPELKNADGWTRWWNPSEFTDPGILGYVPGKYHIHPPSGPPDAMINPYKLFGDALVATAEAKLYKFMPLTDPNARAIFRSGNTNTRQYMIQFPLDGGPIIRFDYAVDASWMAPDPNPPVELPANFPINANNPEAFLVEAEVTDCTLAGTPFGAAGSGELKLSIEVWDWQGWFYGSYAGEIGSVRLYSPLVAFNPPVVEQSDGANHTVLTVTATGVPSTVATGVPVVIEIAAPGTSWKQGWQAAPPGEISAYARVCIDIAQMKCTADENENCDSSVPVELKSSIASVVCIPYDQDDYYVFVVPTGKVMEGTITLDNFDYSDNDMILYDGCPGDAIETALNPGTGPETIEVGNLESGLYYVVVIPGETAGNEVQPYILTLDIEQTAGECTTDNNNTYEEAAPIGLTASDSDSVCAGGDLRDWYKVTVPAEKVAGGTIYLDNHDDGDINIRVYDEYPGPPTYWSTNPGTQDEMVTIDGLGPGVHYIELYAQGVNPQGDRGFTLTTNLTASNYFCTTGDGNDSYNEADTIGYTDEVTDTVCFPADPDWFAFTIPDNKSVHGTITLSGGMMVDNDLFLYDDPMESPIEQSAEVGIADEIITVEKLSTGKYYVKAAAHPTVGGADQPYTLTMGLEEQAVGNYDFTVHAHIICNNDGSNPAASESKVNRDINWANEFYQKYGGSMTLVEISYVKRSSWLAATSSEMYQCHMIYRDKSGPINVYYCNSFPDAPNAAAYCRMDCRYYYQTHNSTYIAMSDYAYDRALAHELAHATAILQDMYLLDWYTCSELYQIYCPYPPNNSYCHPADATYGNLMWWQVAGWDDPEDYWLSQKNYQNPEKPIESQLENWTYFHTNYPDNFPN